MEAFIVTNQVFYHLETLPWMLFQLIEAHLDREFQQALVLIHNLITKVIVVQNEWLMPRARCDLVCFFAGFVSLGLRQ